MQFAIRRVSLPLAVGLLFAWSNVATAQDDAAALWAQATLYRDEWGTPHIYAQTPRALGFAFGYAQAEDHIEAMLMAYRTANGRAAAVAGEKMAASDEFALRMGHAQLARQALANSDDATIALCTGFAMGVNTWLLEHQDSAPAWAEGVKPEDPLALWHAFITSMAPLDLPGIPRPASAMQTGNAWALAPGRTDEGKAILVINPHNYFEGPFRWYEAHLALGGMDVAGATLYGLPVIVQGHNAALGWAFTPNFPDFADVFQEEPQVAPGGGNAKELYERANQEIMQQAPMLEYLSHAEPYYVLTDEGLKERAAVGMVGPRGPIFEVGGTFYSWTIGGFADFGAFSELVAMATAQDLGAFQAALDLQQIPCFNVVYADRAGNVFYLYNAKAGTRDVPVPEARKDGGPAPQEGPNWARPVSGKLFSAAWAHAIPLSSLPSVLNPATGYVQACGGPPWACTDDAPLDAGAFPAWFIGETDTFRARRVRQLLRAGTRTFDDMQAMLYDTIAPAASEMAPLLLEMAETSKSQVSASHPDLETGLALLRDWDYSADTSAKAMTFYHVWWNLLTAKHASEFPNAAALYDALEAKTPAAQNAALGAAADAARLMRNDLNAIEIPWGDVHRIVRGTKDYPIEGADSGEPIFLASGYEYGAGKWRASYGYGMAMAVEFGEEPEAVSVSTFGASEDPRSPHFADQLDLLLNHRFKRTRFAARDVLRHAASALGRDVTLYPLGAEGQVTCSAAVPVLCALESSADPPAPLPSGLAAFTVFVRPGITPLETPAELSVSLAVPAEICGDESLDALALFQYNDAGGWNAVDRVARDDTRRVLSGTPAKLGTFAVLGPEDALIKPSLPEPRPAAAIPEAAKPATGNKEDIDAAPKGESHVGHTRGGTTNLRLKGGYESDVARAPKDIMPSDRGVRVLQLRGQDVPANGLADAPDAGQHKGHALWLEGLPKDIKFNADGTVAIGQEADAPAVNPLIEAPIRTDAPKLLRPKGDAPVDAGSANADGAAGQLPSAGTAPVPAIQNAAPPQPAFSPEGAVFRADPPARAAAPSEAKNEPAAKDEKPLSRKEKKRKKKEEEARASQQVQTLEYTPSGVRTMQPNGAPQDGFGDTPGMDKRKARR